MKVLKYSLVIVIFTLNSAMAQTQAPNDLDKQYTPGANSIFNSSGKNGQNKGGGGRIASIENSIKFNPLLIPRSIFAVFYERKITDGLTASGGLGVCYGADKIQSFFNGSDFSFDSPVSGKLSLSNILSNSRFDSGGPFLSLGMRVYTGGFFSAPDNFDSGYFEINYRYTSVNLAMNSVINSSDKIVGNGLVTLKSSGFNIMYGYQLTTEGSIKTTHDFYFGMGVRNLKYNEFISAYVSPYNGSSYYQYTASGGQVSKVGFTFLAGYAFGIGF